METLFGVGRDTPKDNDIVERQYNFLEELISERNSDIEFMKFLFSTISNFKTDRQHALIAYFLKYNNKFDDFEKIPLEPTSCGWWGSAVPMLQEQIDYYESLLPLFDTVDFLKHKQHIEQIIKKIRDDIQRERKKDFTEE